MLCRITYALDTDGKAVHISEVERGLAGGCVCAGCGEQLVARQGEETGHHFAHKSGGECPNGYVNSMYHALRRAADETGCIALPPYEKNRAVIENGSGLHVLLPASRVRIDRTEFTTKAGGLISGLLLWCSGRPLIIRLLTSYSDGARNLKRIQEAGLPVVELDLTRDDAIDCAVMRQYMTTAPDNLGWIYNALGEQIWDDLTSRCAKLPVQERENKCFTYGCQVPSMRTDGFACFIKEGCSRCCFFFGQYGFGDEKYILCGRSSWMAEPEDLKLGLAERKKKYFSEYGG